MNEALAITGAILAVLTALVFNRKDVSDLKADMKENNASLKAGIADLRSEMQAGFVRVDARFERLESRMDKMQADIKIFATVNALHHHRISALESAAKSYILATPTSGSAYARSTSFRRAALPRRPRR